jgi:hypothetical protein
MMFKVSLNVGFWQGPPLKTSPGNGTNVPDMVVQPY